MCRHSFSRESALLTSPPTLLHLVLVLMDHVTNSYTMIAVCPLLFLAWKILKRSKFYKPEEVDLVKNLDEVEAYEANFVPRPAKYVK